MKIRPCIGALTAASLTGEARFYVRQPCVIRPTVAADRGPMAAPEVAAVDQQPANARGAHFSEGNLLAGRFGHGAIEAQVGTGKQPRAY